MPDAWSKISKFYANLTATTLHHGLRMIMRITVDSRFPQSDLIDPRHHYVSSGRSSQQTRRAGSAPVAANSAATHRWATATSCSPL